MKTPDPSKYDYIWKVVNFNYLLTTIWISQNYKQRNFIFTFYKGDNRDYISKATRRKLSTNGWCLVQSRLPGYRKNILRLIKSAKQRFIIEGKKNLSILTNQQLKNNFISIVEFGQSLWKQYFWTEFYCYDEVNKRVLSGPKRERRKILAAIKTIQKLKFRLRQQLNQTIYKPGVVSRYLREIKKRLKVKDITHFHYQELGSALLGRQLPKVNRSTFVWGKFNGWKVIIGKKALKIINRFDEYNIKKSAKTLCGQVGNPGTYTGRVKIIPFDLKADFVRLIKSMKKGDVLVTGSTGPEMILACRKAGAIITEEGGITSHAATVSRELGIPCVIGTKIATEILKDGDKVVVDAVHGIIKKI